MAKKESHSKMKDMWYTDLKMQKYLKLQTMSSFEAKTVFSYRTRSANYSENYLGADGLSPCPLCLLHLDCQPMAFQCPVIKDKIEKMFDTVSCQLALTLVKIENVREQHMKQKNLI